MGLYGGALQKLFRGILEFLLQLIFIYERTGVGAGPQRASNSKHDLGITRPPWVSGFRVLGFRVLGFRVPETCGFGCRAIIFMRILGGDSKP